MQVEMRPWNFNAASRWFRVSSIRLQRHTKSLDNFAESTFTQEVPVSRAFEAYPAKPPQAHERILNRLFLMMKTTARIITGGSWPWRLQRLVPTSRYIMSSRSSQSVDQFQLVYILTINLLLHLRTRHSIYGPVVWQTEVLSIYYKVPSSVRGFGICQIFYLPLQLPINIITFLQERCITFQTKEICQRLPNWWLSIKRSSGFSDDSHLKYSPR